MLSYHLHLVLSFKFYTVRIYYLFKIKWNFKKKKRNAHNKMEMRVSHWLQEEGNTLTVSRRSVSTGSLCPEASCLQLAPGHCHLTFRELQFCFSMSLSKTEE